MENYKPVLKRGITMGILSILIFVVVYAIDPMFFAKPKGWILSLGVNLIALPIVFMILGARDCKANFSPYKFGNAFNAAFFTGVTSSLVMLLFMIVFVTVIDPAWEAELSEAVVESTMEMMEKFGASEDDIEKAMEQAKEKIAKQPTGIVKQFMGTGQGLVWYAILALIIGAVQKDKKQEELID
jgi:hypothetical protein